MLAAAMNRLLKADRLVVKTRKDSGHERSYLAVADGD